MTFGLVKNRNVVVRDLPRVSQSITRKEKPKIRKENSCGVEMGKRRNTLFLLKKASVGDAPNLRIQEVGPTEGSTTGHRAVLGSMLVEKKAVCFANGKSHVQKGQWRPEP